MENEKYLLRIDDGIDYTNIDNYRRKGGYRAARKALFRKPHSIIEEVKSANLRGRGGAGFPAGIKWGFVPKESEKPKYLVVNADEGEPGTFKDRYFLRYDPHRLIEGIIIASYAVGIHTAYIYIRGEFFEESEILEKAISDAYSRGYLGKKVFNTDFHLDVYVHRGAGAYICGEETALLNSLEGGPGKPRLKPPFPAVVGLFSSPTVINNVETISSLPLIIDKGGKWFASLGIERDGGVKIFGLSGHVKKPGLYELPMGYNLKKFIFEIGGGVIDDKPLKAVIPGGSSTPVLLPDEIDIPMSFDSLKNAGSMFGTGCATIIAEGTCMVKIAEITARFYAHESCGQCTPCRQGCPWLYNIIHNIETGKGKKSDIDLILKICDNIQGNTICPLGDACVMPIRAMVLKFKHEFIEHIEKGGCPYKEN